MDQQDLERILVALAPMKRNPLGNYIVPGLQSSLIGGETSGKVRLFTMTRTATDFVTPHSHRFDFTALVLRGRVRNTLFFEGAASGDFWCGSSIDQVCDLDGLRSYTHTRDKYPARWNQRTDEYRTGDVYSMTYDEVHSIQFDRGTEVLFFEGPEVVKTSRMIEPWVNGDVVPTFETRSWMFQRGEAAA